MRKLLQRLMLVVFSFTLMLVMLEIGLRIYLNEQGTENQRVLYLYSREEINERATRFEGVAFLNYRLSPTYDQNNSLGYRGPEITVPKPAGVYRIVALGGSSTYGEFINDWQDSYPAQLESLLRTEYGYEHVEVINAGVPGYTSWESAANFMFRVLDLEPDMVIIYHAINDVNPRLTDPATYDGLFAWHGYWDDYDEPLPVSTLYRFVKVRLFDWQPTVTRGLDRHFVSSGDYRACGLEIQGDQAYCANLDMAAEDVLAANPPVYFERNIRNIISVAQTNNIDVLLSSWAYSPHEFDRPGGDFLSIPFRQNAVDEHNAVLRQLGDEQPVLFFDLAAVMPQEQNYWVDGMHVNRRGAAEQARFYAEFLDEAGVISAP